MPWMADIQGPSEAERLLRLAFEEYAAWRVDWYQHPGLLRKLLARDLFPFVLRGTKDAFEFLEQSFFAHEAGSEETMIGNAWQAAITRISPNTVGGGDLRTERDGDLWIIQVKMSPKQNSSARAQDLRLLQNKLQRETDHQPGRKSVKAMMAYLSGEPRSQWVFHRDRSKSGANRDIDGFQYQLMVGSAFFRWLGVDYQISTLLTELRLVGANVRQAREASLKRLEAELGNRLREEQLDSSMESLMALQERPWPRRPARRTKILS
jgi:hypothetical protein